MHRINSWVVLAWIVDSLRISEWCIRVEEVIRASRERNPLVIRMYRGHMCTKDTPSFLDRGRHAGLPLVKGLPGGLDGADDPFLEMSRILLHYDDGFLEGILLINLLVELTNYSKVGNESAQFECEVPKRRPDCTHGSVLAVTCSGVFLKVATSVES